MARRKRSHNRGYWYRAGRGWYVTKGKSAEPLHDARDDHIKSADAAEEAKQAGLGVKFEMQRVVLVEGLRREFGSRDVFGGGRSGVVGLG
jgi:hypothetical protein